MQRIDYACSCGKTETVTGKTVSLEPKICKCGLLMASSTVMEVDVIPKPIIDKKVIKSKSIPKKKKKK